LLEKKPSRRFATATEAQQALANALNRLQQPRPWRARRWLRRFRGQQKRLAAAAVVALAIVGLLGFPDGFRARSVNDNTTDAVSSTPSTTASIDVVALELVTRPTAFANELDAIEQSLTKIASAPDPEAILLRSTSNVWMKDLQAAAAAVTQLEKSWPVGLDESSPQNSSKGQEP
jgi:hypothetical protein